MTGNSPSIKFSCIAIYSGSHVYVCVCVCTCMCVYVHVCVCVCMWRIVYAYICIVWTGVCVCWTLAKLLGDISWFVFSLCSALVFPVTTVWGKVCTPSPAFDSKTQFLTKSKVTLDTAEIRFERNADTVQKASHFCYGKIAPWLWEGKMHRFP